MLGFYSSITSSCFPFLFSCPVCLVYIPSPCHCNTKLLPPWSFNFYLFTHKFHFIHLFTWPQMFKLAKNEKKITWGKFKRDKEAGWSSVTEGPVKICCVIYQQMFSNHRLDLVVRKPFDESAQATASWTPATINFKFNSKLGTFIIIWFKHGQPRQLVNTC